jgi:putative phosphoribosyl transferase
MTAVLTPPVDQDVGIALRGFDLAGRLTVPDPARGVVVFAHDVGVGAHNAADLHVARCLHALGLGTLRFDLRAPHEVEPFDATPDLDVFAVRLLVATRWLRTHTGALGNEIAYFGTRTGAAVALLAAAEDPAVGAVVARDGRLDLVGSALDALRAPTLLIVDRSDPTIRRANERAVSTVSSPHDLVVVSRGREQSDVAMLDTSARLAGVWLLDQLRAHPKETRSP